MDAVTVALDTGPLYGPRTGVATAVENLLRSLTDPNAATNDHRGATGIRVVPYVVSFRARLDSGTRRLPLPAALAHRSWGRVRRPRVDRWLRPAQVVHGTNYVVPPSRLPRLVSVYDCWFLRHLDEVDPHVRRAARVLRREVRAGAMVHASSHATAAEVAELLDTDRVRVVHLGACPPDPAMPTQPPVTDLPGGPFVLALGTLERRKNLPRLVRAFDAVAAHDPDVRLVLAGSDGDDRPSINDALDAMKPDHVRRVLLTGRIDAGVKAWLLHHASVLAYPSLDEGFGFPLMEAMATGVPIVASTAGSIPEVAGRTALLVHPLDVDALAESILLALHDEAVRARLREAAPQRLAEFTWERTAAGLAEVYRELADSGPAG